MFVRTDLHGHTFFSDGRATPEAFVSFRRGLGMQVVAISDHDLMAGVRRGAVVAHAHGMVLLPAQETTAVIHFGTPEAEQVHVLAYFPPSVLSGDRLERTALYARGLKVQAAWREFVCAWLSGLPEDDRHALDPTGELPRTEAGRFPALQSWLDRLSAHRPDRLTDFRLHHVRFWTEDRELFGWRPEEMMDAIRADGAVDVVAHAVRVRDKARMDEVLAYASGVEVYTSRHNASVAAGFRDYAERHGKLWTASSDDHQNAAYMQPPCGTPVATMERLLNGPVPAGWLSAA